MRAQTRASVSSLWIRECTPEKAELQGAAGGWGCRQGRSALGKDGHRRCVKVQVGANMENVALWRS